MAAFRFLASFSGALLLCSAAFADEAEDLMEKIDKMASSDERPGRSVEEAAVEGVEGNPALASKLLIPKLGGKGLTERQQSIYAWALGLTKDQAAAPALAALSKESGSDLVQGNCLRSLSMIGGPKAEETILAALDAAKDANRQFEILNLLGQMQCEAALPKTEGILKEDQSKYWQCVFVFGKMGDKSVPFLLGKVADKDRNVRINAINVLGQWLIAPEAAKPLQDQYSIEEDPQIRYLILCSFERVMLDLDQMSAFFSQAAALEKNPDLAKFASETVANIGKLKATASELSKSRKPSSSDFQEEYAKIFKSAGRKGDWKKLAASCSPADEPKLKALREKILQRNSDECFYDYHKVNGVILASRRAAQAPDAKDAKR